MFTDFAGQPIHEGDTVVIPNGRFRTGRSLIKTTVEKIVPLVPDLYQPGANYLVREDHARHQSRRHFPIVDQEKQYIAMVSLVTNGYNRTTKRASVEPSNIVVVQAS